MKKIILFLLFPFLCFSQEKTIESFFQEYNYNCENYSVEDLYEFFGFDIEDDVTPALEAINSFCENGSESNKNESFIFAEETIGYVNGTEVNFRNEPSLNSKVISQLNRPEEIIILDIVVTSDIKYKYWYKIKTKENEIGYIYYLLVVTDPKLIGSDLKKSLKEVIFYDSKLGPIKFSNKLPITIKLLKKIFPEHKVTKGIGQGDSPDFYYFGVSKENKTIQISSFIQYKDYNLKQIKSPHQNNINIDLLAINSNEIKDQYGLSVGDTYKDIIRKRKGELVIQNNHHGKIIGKDQIYYSIWGNFDNKSYADVSPVNIPNEQLIKHNWEIISISWPSPIW